MRSSVTWTMGILVEWGRSKATLDWNEEKIERRAGGNEYKQLLQLVLLKREE